MAEPTITAQFEGDRVNIFADIFSDDPDVKTSQVAFPVKYRTRRLFTQDSKNDHLISITRNAAEMLHKDLTDILKES